MMSFPFRSLTGLIAGTIALNVPALAQSGSAKKANKAGATPSAATAAPKPAAKPVKLPPNVVAQVNGQNITRTQLLSTLDTFGGQPILSQMITAAILQQEAKRQGVTVTDAEIKKLVDETKRDIVSRSMMQGKPMTFAEIANRNGITEGFLRYRVRQQLLAQKAYQKAVAKNIPSLESQIKVSHILIATVPLPTDPGATPPTPEQTKQKEADAKKKIESILADIRSGKTTFADAAKQNSDDKGSGAQGGVMDIWFSKVGQMDPAFSSAAFALAKPGDISEPVKSQFGWHIIRLDKKGADATAAEKAAHQKTETERMAQNPQGGINAWLANLTNNARIITNPAGAVAASAKSVTR